MLTEMSELGSTDRTAPKFYFQQIAALFDHIVSLGEQRERHCEAE